MTTLPAWREEAIERRHDRKRFDCGHADLNAFVAQYARQSHQSGAAKTYCAIDAASRKTILGFYTISPGEINLHQNPLAARPGGGGHYALGGYRLARQAVAKAYQGESLGGHLLANAVERCMKVSAEVGGTALLIDAKDAAAAGWYRQYGAMPLDDRPLSRVITYAEFNNAREAAGLPPLCGRSFFRDRTADLAATTALRADPRQGARSGPKTTARKQPPRLTDRG
ncbi:MAG: hypothetical protein ACREFU_17745 [Acetobacteraceae bacterium]